MKPSRPYKRMTPEKIEAMRSLRKEGYMYHEIAARVGCDKQTVYTHCRDIHVPFKRKAIKYTPELIAQIRELRAKGMKCVEIGAKLKCSPAAVSRYTRGMSPLKITQQDVDRIRHLYSLGKTPNEIAKRMRRAHTTVAYYLEHDLANVMPETVEVACKVCNWTIVVNVPSIVACEVDKWLQDGRAVCEHCHQSFRLLDLTNRPVVGYGRQSVEARRVWYTLLGITFAD